MIVDEGENSLVMPRAAWAKLASELHRLERLLCRLRSSSSDERRLGLIGLTGHEAEMVASLGKTAAMVSVAPGDVTPMVLR